MVFENGNLINSTVTLDETVVNTIETIVWGILNWSSINYT